MNTSTLSPLAILNDAFRKDLSVYREVKGKRLHTDGIEAFGLETALDIWARVRTFNQFTVDNDPYGEHDFGSFTHPIAGKIFWKIDYYDRNYEYGSADPLDNENTRRVLTVMLADEL